MEHKYTLNPPTHPKTVRKSSSEGSAVSAKQGNKENPMLGKHVG